jgi:hypothetical protein
MAARRPRRRNSGLIISSDPVANVDGAFRHARAALLKARMALAHCEDAVAELYGRASLLQSLAPDDVEGFGETAGRSPGPSGEKELPRSLRDLVSPRTP